MKKKARLVYSDVFAAVLCGVLVILPWISHLKLWRISDRAAGIYANVDGICPDLFLYDREVFVIVVGILMLLFLVGEHIFPDQVRKDMPIMNRCNRWIISCVLIYISDAAASALFSADRYTTVMGAVTEGEGVFAVISYMLLFLAAMNYFGGKHTWKFLYVALMFLMIITIVLSCIEFFYRPLFEISFFKNMLAGAEYQPYLDSIQNESYRNFVTLTFYNPNYFGGFCLLLIPFSIEFLIKSRGIYQVVGYALLLSGMFFCVITAKSTVSLYLAMGEMLMLGMISWLSDKNSRKILLRNAGVFILLLLAVLLTVYGVNGQKLRVVGRNVLTNQSEQKKEIPQNILTDIKIEGNCLILFFGKKQLAAVADKEVRFYDESGKQIESRIIEDGSLEFIDKEYAGIKVTAISDQIIFDLGYEDEVYFYLEDGVFYGIGQNGQKLTEVSLGEMEERTGTEMYGWFTGRGYAWRYTFPLLKDTLFIGRGAGNFALYFPQNDYVGLLNTHGSHRVYIDKPHSMYLQTAVNQGMPALLALLVIFAGTFLRYIKIQRRYRAEGIMLIMKDASFAAFLAFALYSCLNDSIVTVNPIFWIVLGVLEAALTEIQKNGMTLEERKKNVVKEKKH